MVICFTLGSPIAPTWMTFCGRKRKHSECSVSKSQNNESCFGDPSLEDDPTIDELLQKVINFLLVAMMEKMMALN